jgi:hypothetical protein
MRDVYLDFRLPWPTKIAAGMLTPEKWRPFEIYLTTTWTASYFDHAYLGFPSIKSNGFFTKTFEETIRFDAGKAKICLIKVRGSPCGGKVNFK